MFRALKSELIRLKRPSFLVGGIGLMALLGALATFISFEGAGTTGAGPAAYFPSEAALAAKDGLVAGMCPGQDIFLSTYAAQWISACPTTPALCSKMWTATPC